MEEKCYCIYPQRKESLDEKRHEENHNPCIGNTHTREAGCLPADVYASSLQLKKSKHHSNAIPPKRIPSLCCFQTKPELFDTEFSVTRLYCTIDLAVRKSVVLYKQSQFNKA
jgi:hypothetical protein